MQNFFKSDISISYKDHSGNTHPAPPYSTLSKEDYLKITNICYNDILPSYKDLAKENDNIYELANTDMLKMLLAYDEKPKLKLLKATKEIAKWIIDEDDCLVDNIKILNYLQIIKRERNLNKEEIRQLCEIAENLSSSVQEKVGAYILLDNQISAEFHFEKLDSKDQESFKAFPIYKFYVNQELNPVK